MTTHNFELTDDNVRHLKMATGAQLRQYDIHMCGCTPEFHSDEYRNFAEGSYIDYLIRLYVRLYRCQHGWAERYNNEDPGYQGKAINA